jgi:hypothetical protein
MQRDRVIRQAAAKIREGGDVSDARMARLAATHLRNRAAYDARRKKVRDLAAQIRAGKRPRAAQDLLDAARRWLAYRAWYNEQRRKERPRR